MDYKELYNSFSPIKMLLNNEYINTVQKNNPLILSFDNNAYDNLSNMLSKKFKNLENKSYLISKIQFNSFKIFLVTFIILYILAPKYDIIRVHDDLDDKNYKPNILRIFLISFIVSIFLFTYQGINLLAEIKNILLKM